MLLKHLGAKVRPALATNDADLSVFGLHLTTKADILKALSDSYDYGEAVIKEFPGASMTQTIQGPRWIGEAARAKMVYYTLGLVPPASRRGGV